MWLDLANFFHAFQASPVNFVHVISDTPFGKMGQSQTFATGLSLSHKDNFDTQKWKKNALGKLLMKVRQELTV